MTIFSILNLNCGAQRVALLSAVLIQLSLSANLFAGTRSAIVEQESTPSQLSFTQRHGDTALALWLLPGIIRTHIAARGVMSSNEAHSGLGAPRGTTCGLRALISCGPSRPLAYSNVSH